MWYRWNGGEVTCWSSISRRVSLIFLCALCKILDGFNLETLFYCLLFLFRNSSCLFFHLLLAHLNFFRFLFFPSSLRLFISFCRWDVEKLMFNSINTFHESSLLILLPHIQSQDRLEMSSSRMVISFFFLDGVLYWAKSSLIFKLLSHPFCVKSRDIRRFNAISEIFLSNLSQFRYHCTVYNFARRFFINYHYFTENYFRNKTRYVWSCRETNFEWEW